MKVKLLIAFCLFLTALSITAKAQTKEETEKWIVEKFKKTMVRQSFLTTHGYFRSSYEITPTDFYIKDGKIYIAFTEVVTDENEHRVESTHYVLASVNIYSISEVKLLPYDTDKEDLKFSGKGLSFLYLTINCNCIKYQGQTIFEVNKLPLLITGSEEPDLMNRINKAFTQLKTFYPAAKETF